MLALIRSAKPEEFVDKKGLQETTITDKTVIIYIDIMS
jgi:hypothetical protein